MEIVYVVRKLQFPLAEGNKKQAWELAKVFSRKHNVTVIHFGEKSFFKEDIPIVAFHSFKQNTIDVIHFISPTIKELFHCRTLQAKKRVISLYDGKIGGFFGVMPNLLLWWFKLDTAILYSRRQLPRLRNYVIVPPLKPKFKQKKKKTKQPSLLFMHVLIWVKGIHVLLKAFHLLKRKDLKLKLVAIKNPAGIKKQKQIEVVEGFVDAEAELSKAWIYLYPVVKATRTLAVPLSFIEAIQCGTPFIGTTVGAIPDYFDKKFLVPPNDPEQLARKIEDILDHYSAYRKHLKHALKKKWTNEDVVRKLERIYKGNI